MTNINNIISFAIVAVFLVSCLEVMELKHDNSKPVLIVEGQITNQLKHHSIKLSTTISFNSSERSNEVDNAVVVISDEHGHEELLNYTENGIYETSKFQGVSGTTYFLNIEYDGVQYTSQSTIQPVADIDSLKFKYHPATIDIEAGYFVTMGSTAIRPDVTDYLRWKIYENDSLYNGINDIIISDDEYVDGDYEFEFPYPFELGDTVKIEMYAMNEDALIYYKGFVEVLQSDGGLFSPPPVNSTSNLTNGALGLFQAYSVTSKEIIIK